MKLSKKKGFSLLEIVIAIALLGLVMVTICTVFARGLQAIKKGQKSSAALYIANKKIDEVVNADLSDPYDILPKKLCENIAGYDPSSINPSSPDIDWDDTFDTTVIKGQENVGEVKYDFEITIKGYVKDLKKVIVKLTWVDPVMGGAKSMVIHTLLAKKATIEYQYE